MQFGRREPRGKQPVSLKRKDTIVKVVKKTIYDGLALVVSAEAIENETDAAAVAFCELCDGSTTVKRCKRDLKNVHEEADLIAKVYRRFDYNLI